MDASDLRKRLQSGLVIPAHPLALNASRNDDDFVAAHRDEWLRG